MNILFNFENRLCNHLRQPISSLIIRNSKFSDIVAGYDRPFSSFRVFSSSLRRKPTAFEPIVARGVCRKFNLSIVVRSVHKSIFDVDTNVKKDVLLYLNESVYFYLLNYLAVLSVVAWSSIAYFFIIAVKVIPDEKLKIFQYLDISQRKWKIIIPCCFVLTGATE